MARQLDRVWDDPTHNAASMVRLLRSVLKDESHRVMEALTVFAVIADYVLQGGDNLTSTLRTLGEGARKIAGEKKVLASLSFAGAATGIACFL